MKQVLDILIIEFSDILEVCRTKSQLLTVLMPPLAIPSLEDGYSISSICPRNLLSDPAYLFAELANAADDSFNRHSAFPMTCRAYKLARTAPISVAKNERLFCCLTIFKNFLRSRSTDERINDLMILTCETEILDAIDLVKIVEQ